MKSNKQNFVENQIIQTYLSKNLANLNHSNLKVVNKFKKVQLQHSVDVLQYSYLKKYFVIFTETQKKKFININLKLFNISKTL